MHEQRYHEQILNHSGSVDLDFWRAPQGVTIPDDELQFLLVPGAVEAAAIGEVARQVHQYQADNAGTQDQISSALIVTMGGMLPGILIYDHLVQGRAPSAPKIEFGTIGVSLYEGPGVRYDEPLVQQHTSIPIAEKTIMMIDDLGDRGGTLEFLTQYAKQNHAHKVLNLVLYMKPAAKELCCADFYFGETPQDTWIITPRELVETLVKRVPVWKERGASEAECRRRLITLIGYPLEVVNQYLPQAYALT